MTKYFCIELLTFMWILVAHTLCGSLDRREHISATATSSTTVKKYRTATRGNQMAKWLEISAKISPEIENI